MNCATLPQYQDSTFLRDEDISRKYINKDPNSVKLNFIKSTKIQISQMPLFKKPSSVSVSEKSSLVPSSKPSSSVKKSKSPKNPNEKLPPILSCTWGPVVPKSAIGR
ncbi:unnamed protein product [Umbelopsis sp. WA50703]